MIDVDQPGLVRISILAGLLAFVILVPVIALNFWREIGLGWIGVVSIAALLAIIAGYIFFHQMRETIYVKDLLVGRYFRCGSVVALARKEAYLQTVTSYLRQVMESAKHWDGVEKIEIIALSKDEAKSMILKGPLF